MSNQRGTYSEQRGRGGRGGKGEYRGRGGNQQSDFEKSNSYQPGAAPYQSSGRGEQGWRGNSKRGEGRGGRKGYPEDSNPKIEKAFVKKGEISAEDQFNMLFGLGDDNSKNNQDGTNQLMDLFGKVDQSKDASKAKDQFQADEAIVVLEDEAVLELKDQQESVNQQRLKNLSKEEQAILEAAKQKPLWMEDERIQYSNQQMFDAFNLESQINFDLFDQDYMSFFEIFSQNPQQPFDFEDSNYVDVSKFQDKQGGQSTTTQKKYQNTDLKGKNKQLQKNEQWIKNTNQGKGLEDEDDEEDPEWIEFDPEKERSKFLGHVMEDESKIRENIIKKKENQQIKIDQQKKKIIEQAKMDGMTEEQRNIIADSKNDKADQSNIDKDKLREAERLAAQIEAESFSKFDLDFESKNKQGSYQHRTRAEDVLTDEQLIELFTKMKEENNLKKQKEMKKFVSENPKAEDELLEDFNDELDAMRGEDTSENESEQKKDNQEVEDKKEVEEVKYFNDEFKKQLQEYKEKKQAEFTQTKQRTAESNLQELFQNFQVVSQQRHKIDLEEIQNFKPDEDQKYKALLFQIMQKFNYDCSFLNAIATI